MRESEMEIIADFIAHMLAEESAPEKIFEDVIAFRQPYQTLYYCFDNGLPPQAQSSSDKA